MPITPQVARTARKINLTALDQQLQAEAGELQTTVADPNELAFLNYVFVAAHVGLYWIDGDPYTYKFPQTYEGERLAQLCGYLKRLATADQPALSTERDKQVTLLRDVTWPTYARVCAQYTYHGDSSLRLKIGYQRCGLDSVTTEHDPGPQDTPANALPRFHTLESETFHLSALAVVYLNRAVKAPLLDLNVTPPSLRRS